MRFFTGEQPNQLGCGSECHRVVFRRFTWALTVLGQCDILIDGTLWITRTCGSRGYIDPWPLATGNPVGSVKTFFQYFRQMTVSESNPHSDFEDPMDSQNPPPIKNPSARPVESELNPRHSTSPKRAASPRDRFEQRIAQQRDSLDDHEPEESLWSGGYSPKAMVGWWVILSVVTVALIVCAILFEQLTFGIAIAIIAVLWVLVLLNYARMRMGFHYELTSQRFIHKSGIMTRRTDRIEVIDIDDVSYEQGPVQRMFRVGSINIISSDRSDPELHLSGIDKVGEVAGLIDDVRRAERRRRSLHIESI